VHFRIRKNIVQFIRTSYNPETKKPRALIVGRLALSETSLPAELRAQLNEAELAEAETWMANHHRTSLLREELAARTLAETLRLATSWFERPEVAVDARAIAKDMKPELQAFRKVLKKFQLAEGSLVVKDSRSLQNERKLK
jgi:hypothetical protein